MRDRISVGIVGYGNLGRGVEAAIKQNPDIELIAIFTRREPDSIIPQDEGTPVFHLSKAKEFKAKIDVMILCGGSASDLPEQTPFFAGIFNTVDSFDTHAKIPEHFAAVDAAARAAGTTSLISAGWDPGLFSINRMMMEAILPQGKGYTFWGRGISQGHSDAVRRVKGVKAGVQYTVPISEAIESVRKGEQPELTTCQRHIRECYVVAEEGADRAAIEKEIKNMPNYFLGYETRVIFISEEELHRKHSRMPHGGFVMRSGRTGIKNDNTQIMEFSIKLDSNPEFTGSVLVACARAVYRMNREGLIGAKTVFDIPLRYLSHRTDEEIRKHLL